MKRFILLLAVLSVFACAKDPTENTIVIVRYKALPNKSVDAVTNLKILIEEVKKEDHFVSIRLHVDQKDHTNILLYEEWDDRQYYENQHMKTDHLKDFIVKSQELFAGPPEISIWNLNEVYK